MSIGIKKARPPVSQGIRTPRFILQPENTVSMAPGGISKDYQVRLADNAANCLRCGGRRGDV